MFFKMIKSEGIAHHSYFIGDGGKAAVVDPRRDVDVYLELAEEQGLDIIHILETHRNEDYVIGSLELQDATGADIYHGKNLEFAYGTPVGEGDKFFLGPIELEVLETPGHTLESISLVLQDPRVSPVPQMVFTGDVIFAGETGRIDFYGRKSRPQMAGLLYESLFEKILPLGDGVVLCPSHGAGSVCGADIQEQDYTTIGYEKQTNPSLQVASKEEFVAHKITEELYYPPYFKMMEVYNQQGCPIIRRLPHLKALHPDRVQNLRSSGAQLLDIRKPTSYAGGHIPSSLNIWKEGLPAFVGWYLNYEDPIILINDHEPTLDLVRRSLMRLGYDHIAGYLQGGFPNWYINAQEVEPLPLWTVQQLRERQFMGEFYLLDVRKRGDWDKGYIEGAHHLYVGEVPQKLEEIPKDQSLVIYCDSGYKSTIAASYLQKEGYPVTSVLGSMNAWMKAHYPVVKN
ncbi:MAG: MBL fold metallo-hydrolase [Methanobacteriales archaeon Met13]